MCVLSTLFPCKPPPPFTWIQKVNNLHLLIKISKMKLFDAHCHLQDPRIHQKSHQAIANAVDYGVEYIAVNGVSEKDWNFVKLLSQSNPSVLPNFGLHPWFINERTPNWLSNLKQFLEQNPESAVGEIGLDKAPWANHTDYNDQVEVFTQQLQLAKKIKRPASIHCVDAFDDLMKILKSNGPFPDGFILHSYIGSADIVPQIAELGGFFSISGHFMNKEEREAKEILKSIPIDRILVETDCPDAFPKNAMISDDFGKLNQPANVRFVVGYVADLVELEEEEVAEISYRNARRLFSYQGSKISA